MPQIITPTSIVVTNVRVSYANVFTPRQVRGQGDPKYSLSVLIHESDEENLNAVDAAIKAAIMSGLEKGTLLPAHAKYNPTNNSFATAATFKMPLHNGSEQHTAGQRGPEYNEHFFFNANSKDAPTVLIDVPGQGRMPIIDPAEFYSGCYAHVSVNFYPFNNVSVGVGVGLNHILKTEDGDRLDGRISAEDAFAAFDAAQPDENDAPAF